ncbi:MAG: hypothetical protein IKR91_07760 [Alloprevotella sp.]|nr:hypothetical protein [Alloprevotella sp.]
MKKFFLSMVALVGVTMISCTGNKTDANAEVTDTAAVYEVSEAKVAANTLFDKIKNSVSDPTQLQLVVGAAQAKIQEYLQSGDSTSVKIFTEEFQKLLSGDTTVTDALKNASSAIAGAVAGKGGNLLDAFNSVLGAASQKGATAASFLDATKKAGTNALTEKGAEVVSELLGVKEDAEAAKDAVVNAAEGAVDAAKAAPEAAKAAAEEAVNKKVDEGKQKAADAINKGAEKANEKINEAAQKGLKKLGL